MNWGYLFKQNSVIMKQKIFILLSLFFVMSCQGQKTFQQINAEELNQVPTDMEIPESPDSEQIDPTLDQFPTDQQITTNPIATVSDQTQVLPSDSDELMQPSVPSTDENKPSPFRPHQGHKPTNPTVPNKPMVRSNDVLAPTPEGPSKFIQIAMWVIKNESRKIGTACNFYVSRVLELAGYSDDSFIANDFDIYARRNFSSAEAISFDTNNVTPERQRLRRHIWSYPERTPFILNWERSEGRHGHIAILERIGDQLVIFQASMNQHLPLRQQTTIENILSYSKKAKLTVYTNFRP